MIYHTWSDLSLKDHPDCLWRMDWMGAEPEAERVLGGHVNNLGER